MFSRVSEKGAKLAKKVDAATASHLTAPDANINSELAALAGSDKKASYWIVKHLRHKLWDKQTATVSNAVQVFRTLMATNSQHVYFEMNRKGIQEFEKLYWEYIKQSRRGFDVAIVSLLRMVLQCIEDWYDQLKTQRIYTEFSRVYHTMITRGVKFPSQVGPVGAASMQNYSIPSISFHPSSSQVYFPPQPKSFPDPPTPSSTGLQYRILRPTFFLHRTSSFCSHHGYSRSDRRNS